jgi:cytochrome P450
MDSGHLTASVPASVGAPAALRQPPRTRVRDLFGLALHVLRALPRGRGGAAAGFAAWLHDMTRRYQSKAVLLRLGPKRVLLVAGEEIARDILEPPPSEHGFVAGALKADAMGFLAHRALTVAHGADWHILRRYNEQVLSAPLHSHQQYLLDATQSAFAPPIRTIDDARRAMGHLMLNVVAGRHAPPRLVDDVQELFALVQSPLRRRFAGARGRELRTRFYQDLRAAWNATRASDDETLLGSAHQYASLLEEEDALHQVPHWMFTFPGSGTDLLVRSLCLIAARPAVRARALHEITTAGSPLEVAQLDYLDACLREAGRLFPPVTKTFHRAPAGATAGGYVIARDTDVMHYLPLFSRYGSAVPDAHAFRPERWLDPAAPRPYPDMFLSGARACPGQHLILFVCKAAAATLLARGIRVNSDILAQDPLPLVFPGKEARFGYDSDHN